VSAGELPHLFNTGFLNVIRAAIIRGSLDLE
jgi:hypothetical protein